MREDMIEPEVLSYREFKNRETLLAWERRRQAIDSQVGRASERNRRTDVFMKLVRGLQATSSTLR